MTPGCRLVYVVGPYAAPTGDEMDRNLHRAAAIGALAARRGARVVVPHTHGWFGIYGSHVDAGHDAPDRRAALKAGEETVAALTAVPGFGLWVIQRDDGSLSEGSALELQAYRKHARPHAWGYAQARWHVWARRIRDAGLSLLLDDC